MLVNDGEKAGFRHVFMLEACRMHAHPCTPYLSDVVSLVAEASSCKVDNLAVGLSGTRYHELSLRC